MDIDEPLNTPPPPSDTMDTQEAPEQASNNTPSTHVLSESASFSSSRASVASASSEAPVSSNANRKQESKRAQGSNEQPVTSPASAVSNQCSLSSPAQLKLSDIPTLTAPLPHMSVSSSGGNTHQVPTRLEIPDSATSTSLAMATVRAASVLPSTTTTAAPGSSTHASTSATPTATAASATTASPAPSSSCAPAAAGPDAPTTSMNTTSKAAADSSNIVSLKIIISDNQEEDSVSDTALSQAISSISGDKIPTIYLSSPAKTTAVPGTPKASLDEVAQAVSGLQSSEAQANLLSGGKTGAVMSSPLTGISQAQQSYIIQVPLDTTNPSTASYFLVTEHPTSDAQGRQKLVPAAVSTGQPLSPSHFGVNTPRSQGFSPGPALILPSPVKPVVLPVSVMGQNPLGNVQMVSNQLVAIPNPIAVQQPETAKPKQSTTAGAEQTVGGRVVQSLLAENTGQQNVAVGPIPSHRRILCFDSSGEVQQQTTKRVNATASAPCVATPRSVPQTVKDHSQSVPRAKPAILGSNKPKRRIETVRCSDVGQFGKGLMKEPEKTTPPQQSQKDAIKKSSRKQDHTLHIKDPHSASSRQLDSPQSPKKSESGRRSKSTERKHNHGVDDDGAKAHKSQTSGSVSSDSLLKSGGRKDKEESSRKEPSKTREGRNEKKTASQEIPNVTANKENEMKGSMQEQQSPPSTSGPSTVSQPTSNIQSKTTKPPSKTSSLAKQAAEMLQDIQGLNSPSTPRGGVGSADHLPRTPGTGRIQEESADSPRTPSRQKKDKDAEGTPKRLVPPNTSDVPTCSPASEAGSENSINMAAHTLMILSRAAIARTGTPLKDSLRQEGVAEQAPSTSKMSKKRKQSSPTSSPPAKKESKRSPSTKKDRERKKLVDCFPHDLDVDKFLSSLHYDE
uniref:Protein NPAT C-terminal domain-containing protein n=2 Tax=Sphaeramia orbicularis TaxID=375764 RepID=A0A672Y5J5_9TELE